MLRAVRGLVVVSFLLGVIASALPYISAAAFGPMMQVVADAGTHGTLSRVWDLQGPVLATDDDLIGSLAGPVVPFGVLLAAWAISLLLTQLMYFVNAWVGAKVDRMLVTDIRQRVHDHLQTLSLDFFTASRSGALMQRVLVESADWPLAEKFERQEKYVDPVRQSADAKEGALAFVEKRTPVWTGQ